MNKISDIDNLPSRTSSIDQDHWSTNETNEELSFRLYRILEDIGVSEKTRQTCIKLQTAREILRTVTYDIFHGSSTRVYVVGSKYEGTVVTDSDIDLLYSIENEPVVENIEEAPSNGQALCLLLNSGTKPGYVKLQKVVNGIPLTIDQIALNQVGWRDENGRILKAHVFGRDLDTERKGPAESECGANTNHVFALRCQTVPEFAGEWLFRLRNKQWPLQSLLKRMEKMGCFFVGIGHPQSPIFDRLTQWRISFSLQERELMLNLSSTQHKCYVLLKMIKKDIIQQRVGESITSYHCKTCLFYTIENSDISVWAERNLLRVVNKCLELLLQWVKEGNCPNFFIKEENMFDKLNEETLEKVSNVLESVLCSGGRYLSSLRCHNLGQLVSLTRKNKHVENFYDIQLHHEFEFRRDYNSHILYARNDVLYNIHSQHVKSDFQNVLSFLKHTEEMKGHKPCDVRYVLDRLKTHLHLFEAQRKASILLQKRQECNLDKMKKDLCKHLQKSLGCDTISSHLIKATVFFQFELYEYCAAEIFYCINKLKPYVLSECRCYQQMRELDAHHKDTSIFHNLTYKEYPSECTATCIIFTREQANLVHKALHYEMFRSIFTLPGDRNELVYFWFDLINIDSKVYIYFLDYLCKSSTEAFKRDTVRDMEQLLKSDLNLGHTETALNILGWICMQESQYKKAFRCFIRSLKERPIHNAAKWHMLILMHDLVDLGKGLLLCLTQKCSMTK